MFRRSDSPFVWFGPSGHVRPRPKRDHLPARICQNAVTQKTDTSIV